MNPYGPTPPRTKGRFRVGDRVRIVVGFVGAEAEILEDRGPIGVGGRRFYFIRIPVLYSEDILIDYPEDEMAARKWLRDAVFSAAGPSVNDLARLRSLRRRVFVVYRSHGDDPAAPVPARFDDRADVFQKKFATDEIAVWELTVP